MSLLVIGIASYVVIGVLAGILGGLLGLGGGVVTVPCLLIVFRFLGYSQTEVMHMAIGTSLAAMVFTSIGATIAHNRKKAVLWNVVGKMAPGFVIGSLAGAFAAVSLSDVILEIVFGLFLCALGIYILRGKVKITKHHQLPSPIRLSFLSAGIGAISNILGIGGGTLTVPLLAYFKVGERVAIATSSATTLLLSLMGTLSYLFLGRENTPSIEKAGYINLLAFLIIGTVSFFLAPYGAKLAHELPTERVRKIFACVVILTGILMLFF